MGDGEGGDWRRRSDGSRGGVTREWGGVRGVSGDGRLTGDGCCSLFIELFSHGPCILRSRADSLHSCCM